MKTHNTCKTHEQGWMLGCGLYHWVNIQLPKLFVFMNITLCLMFKMLCTGRTLTLSIAFGVIHIMRTQSPRNPHISLVA